MCEVFLSAAEWAEVLADARRMWLTVPESACPQLPDPDTQSD